MDIYDILEGRRTIQRFRPDPIDEAALERALGAARFAPNHKLTWPFRFTLPGPRTRAQLCDVGLAIKAAAKGHSPELEQAVRHKMLDPARLVVVSQVLDDDAFRRQEDYATCAAAIQNIQLALHAEGIGTKWSTGGVTRDPRSYAALGIDPEREAIVGFVWVGLPAVVPRPPQRPPLDEVLRRTP